ncbi:MAG TPA: glutaredoxin family protein [Planctomycetota bacterium]|nr:glutaredoxin family protein [Planctomycetota bacterium]
MSLLDRLLGRAPEPVPLTLYSRPGCHLCELLEQDLERADLGRPVSLEVLDISGDARLEEHYGKRIPVLLAAGKPIAEGRVDVHALRPAFEARAAEWDRARELSRALAQRSERG